MTCKSRVKTQMWCFHVIVCCLYYIQPSTILDWKLQLKVKYSLRKKLVWSVYKWTIIFLEGQFIKFQTGRDVATVLEKESFLRKNRGRKLFKKVLGAVGRHDLSVKLENYIAKGKSK